MGTSITEDCDYIAIKNSSKEFSQLEYCLRHMGPRSNRLCSVRRRFPSRRPLVADPRHRWFPFQHRLRAAHRRHAVFLRPHVSQAAVHVAHARAAPRGGVRGLAWRRRPRLPHQHQRAAPRDPIASTQLEATRNIRPEVADELGGLAGEDLSQGLVGLIETATRELEDCEDSLCTCAELNAVLHSHGISVRHEGMLYKATTKMWLKDLLYVDMLARTAKCILWKNFRWGRRGTLT